MPARSAGANPVRQANASCGEVSQLTWVIAMPPRSWASISAISPYSTRARPSRPPPHSLAVPRDPGLGDHDGDERLGAHRRRGQALSQVVVDLPGQAGAAGRRCCADPQVPFGAVVGHGADHEQHLVDQSRSATPDRAAR